VGSAVLEERIAFDPHLLMFVYNRLAMFVKRAISFLFLLLASSALKAQFKNIMLDEQGENHPYVCEPTIAINPRYPNNIVAGSVLNNYYFTKDMGVTWKKGTLTSPLGVYGDPAIIADQKGISEKRGHPGNRSV
jgi:hypothetical protein